MSCDPRTPVAKAGTRHGAGTRRQPPARRLSETRRVRWQERTVHIAIGYDDSGLRPLEVFYNAGYRSGSEMEALISDLCIALSVMLQHEEVTARHLSRSMSRAFSERTGQAEPASVLGVLLTEIMRPPAWADAEPDTAQGAEPVPSAGGAADGAGSANTPDSGGTGGAP